MFERTPIFFASLKTVQYSRQYLLVLLVLRIQSYIYRVILFIFEILIKLPIID